VLPPFPPGNLQVEPPSSNRLFSHISMNWRGRPLTSHEVHREHHRRDHHGHRVTVRAALDTAPTPPESRSATRQWPPCPCTATTGTRLELPPAPRPPPARRAASPGRRRAGPPGRPGVTRPPVPPRADRAAPPRAGQPGHLLDPALERPPGSPPLPAPRRAAPQRPRSRRAPRPRPHRQGPGHPHPPAPEPAPARHRLARRTHPATISQAITTIRRCWATSRSRVPHAPVRLRTPPTSSLRQHRGITLPAEIKPAC